jgi:hypothetical protein
MPNTLDAQIDAYAAARGLSYDDAVERLLEAALRFASSRAKVMRATHAKKTPEQRSAGARHAARARWDAVRGKRLNDYW